MATKIVKTLKFPGSTDEYQINAVSSENGIFYIAGGGTTDTTNKVATWTGSNPAITSYYDGLTIAYKVGTAGSTTTTLNINNLGAVPVVRNVSTAISTAYAVDSIIHLTYTLDGTTARWKVADYTDGDVKARSYKTNTDKDYPVLFRYDNSNSSSYYAEYTRYDQDLNYTYNPGKNLLKVPNIEVPGDGIIDGQLKYYVKCGSKVYNNTSNVEFTAADLGLNQAMRFIGTTTTALTDGSTTSTITIGSTSVQLTSDDAGSVVLYKDSSNKINTEFVWDGGAWRKLGDEGSFSLKTHTHTVTHKPAGTVSQPTFTGTEAGHTHSFSGSASHDHTFTGTAASHDHTFTGTSASHDHSFTGTGVMIKGTFTGTEQTASVSYTPAGTISTPTITVTPNTTTVNSITAVGSLPSLTYEEVAADNITFWSAGSAPSLTKSDVTAKSVKSWSAGSVPSITYSDVSASKITAWSAGSLPSLTFTQGTLPSASLSGGSASLTGSVSTGPNRVVTVDINHSNPTLTFSAGTLPTATFGAGTLPSLTYSDVGASKITAWSAGTAPSLTTEDKTATKISAWSAGSVPTLEYTDGTATKITEWSQGTLPTKGSNTTVVTGIKSATSTQPTFTGTAATISHKHTPAGTVTITTAAPGTSETPTYTPAGTISSKSLTPSGTVGSKSLTPAGTIGSKSVTISGTSGETKITPAGTVSQPTFNGTSATLTTSAANS